MKWLLSTLVALLIATAPAHAQRTSVTSNVDMYVSPASSCTPGYWYDPGGNITIANCGNDATADGTISLPFATCQGAVDWLYSKFDFVGRYAPTIHMGVAASPGQFFYPNCGLSGRLLGQPGTSPPLVVGPGLPIFKFGNYNPFLLLGDPTYPLGAFLVSGDFGYPADRPALSLTDGAALKVQGLAFDTGASQQDCIDAQGVGTLLDVANLLFGACGKPTTVSPSYTNYNLGIGIAFSSHLYIDGDLAISSGDMGAFIQLGQGSSMFPNDNGTTPKFNIAFGGGTFQAGVLVIGGASSAFLNGLTFSGSYSGSTIENGTGAGPNTCPATMILGHAKIVQDNSSCR